MMKRSLRLVGIAGALVVAPALMSAQDSKPISFGVMGGLSLPMGDFGDGYDSGYNVTGNVWFKPNPSGPLGFRGDIGYDAFNAQVSDLTFSSLSFVGNVTYHLGQASAEGGIRPYVIGGLGLYRGSTNVPNSESNTEFGFGAGGGLEFKLSGFTTFAEARFVNVNGDGGSTQWIPITFGVRF